MKLLVDMNLSPLWVEFFVAHGIEAVHWASIGRADASDTAILEYAGLYQCTVFTHDLDFGMLLAARKASGPSVVQVRCQDVLPSGIGATVLRAIRAARPHLDAGAIVTIDPGRERIRLLPI